MHRHEYQMYGGESHPTDKGTKGGVAVLVKSHIQGRAEFSHLEEGCGFEAVDVRLQHTNLLVISVYLQTGTTLHARPNSSIIAELINVVKHWKGVWILAGDFNIPPEEIAATNLLEEMNGRLCVVGEPTTDQGREIDYAIVHRALEPLCTVRLDWSVPHKPHASLTLKLDMGEGLCPTMMLEQHPMHQKKNQAGQGVDPQDFYVPEEDKTFKGEWLQASLPQDDATQYFAQVSEACSKCLSPDHPSDRGQSLKIVRRPLVQPTAPHTKSSAGCSWGRALSWIKAAQQREPCRHKWQTVVDWITSLPAPAGGESQKHTKFQMVEFLATGSGDAQELLDKVEKTSHSARRGWKRRSKAACDPCTGQSRATSWSPSGLLVRRSPASALTCASCSGRKFGKHLIAKSRGLCKHPSNVRWRRRRHCLC